MRHSVEQCDGVIDIAAFRVHADEVVGDEGGGGGAGGDQMGVELFAPVKVSGSGARLDELGQDSVRGSPKLGLDKFHGKVLRGIWYVWVIRVPGFMDHPSIRIHL